MSIAGDNDTQAVTEWIEKHLWTRPNLPNTILIVKPVDSTDQSSTYSIKSGFGYFQTTATYTEGQDTLTNLTVSLDVPSFGLVFLTGSENYRLSTDRSLAGSHLPFDIGNGVIKGHVSFYFAGEGDEKDVYMKYKLHASFTEEQDDTVSIFPVALYQCKSIETGQNSDWDQAAETDENKAADITNQQEQLLKFLDNYAMDDDKIVMLTDDASSSAQTYDVNVNFLNILKFAGSIDPADLSLTAALYVKLPIRGYIEVTGLRGSLRSGIRWHTDQGFAKGGVSVGVRNSSGGGHDLRIGLYLSVMLIGSIGPRELVLAHLPF